MSKDNVTGGFRTAVGGYNKNDVNRYIIKQNEDFKKREAEYLERITELEKQLSEVEDTSELTERIGALESELAELKAENIELKERLESVDSGSGTGSFPPDIAVKVDEILDYAVKEAERIIEEARAAGMRSRDEIARNTELMKAAIKDKSASIIDGFRNQSSEPETGTPKRKPGRPPKKKE